MEKYCKPRDVNSKNQKEILKIKRKKQAKDLNRYFLKKIYKQPIVHEKMFNISNHQRNERQNHSKVPHPLHMHQDDFYQEKKKKANK